MAIDCTKSQLFQYCIIFNPKLSKKDEDEGKTAKAILIKDVTNVLSKDDKEVAILAARQIPEEYLDKLDQVSITVRPF